MSVPLRHGVAVVVWRKGRLLIGLRAGTHGHGTWGLPGGAMDPGETYQQTAARELHEETGLIGEPGVKIGHVDTTFPDGASWRTHYVLTTVADGEPAVMEPTKHDRWSWEDPAALPTPLFAALANYLSRQPLVDPAGSESKGALA